jgi:anaerobic magnesium-protoporphyrin IX monomethyl ester cyclase
MNIALVYPRFRYEGVGLQEEPLGLLYLAAVLRREGHEVTYADLTFASDLEPANRAVQEAHLVGLSSTTPLFGRACEVMKALRPKAPGAKFALGGPHPTIDPEGTLEAGFDIAVLGEGEQSVCRLTDALSSGERDAVAGVEGIAVKENGESVTRPLTSFVKDLDSLPFPARDLADYTCHGRYGLIASRGCPYRCLYCKPMQEKLFGLAVRKRGHESIAEEVKRAFLEHGKRPLQFKDDTLNLYPTHWFLSLREEFLRRGLKPRWTCNGSVKNLPQEKLVAMKKAGCDQICFGVESGSQRILDFYRKEVQVEDIIRAFDNCHRIGIKPYAFLMLGAPIETRDDMEATYRLVRRIKPYNWLTSTTTPLPGNELYEYAKKRGIINIKRWEDFDNARNNLADSDPMLLDHITGADIREYRNKINRALRIHFLLKNCLNPRLWWGLLSDPSLRLRARLFLKRKFR